MKYLVSGCAGFIGAQITEELLMQGNQVLGVDRLDEFLYSSKIKQTRLKVFLENTNFVFIQSDIVEDEFKDLVSKYSPDVIINEAGLPGQSLSWDMIETYSESNFIAAYTLGKIAVELGVPTFLQASTSSVYGSVVNGSEDAAKVPISPYGVTKLAAENSLNALLAGTDTKLIIVRYFFIYSIIVK